MTHDWQAIEQRWQQLLLRRARLAERDALAGREESRLLHQLRAAQAVVQDAPYVREWLDHLQHAQHERAVGAYERMLTAFLQDVLPGEREAVLQLGTEKGLPALDFYIRKGDNQPLEDVLEGTGGSNANILSAGLRFIALMRSGRRKFLVLDEADCWLSPTRALRFATVVDSLARQLGVQVLYISHHNQATLGGVVAHQLHLHHDDTGQLVTDWTGTSEAELGWEAGQTGLRSIMLQDFQAHKTTFLPLSPGVTLLYGDNDIGKSSVTTALRAVVDNDSNDTFIRHGSSAAKVTLDFGPEGVVHWDRQLKGKSKTNYRHMAPQAGPLDDPIHSSKGRGAPEWMSRVLGLGLVDELDVQIGRQKKPIFLLDAPPSMRAKALAVGNDGGYVQRMMAQERSELAEAKASSKRHEEDLERWRRVRQVLSRLGSPTIDPVRWHALSGLAARRQAADAVQARWQGLQARRLALSGLPDNELVLPASPRAPAALHHGQVWGYACAQQAILAHIPADGLALPQAHGAQRAALLGQHWAHQGARAEALRRVPAEGLAFPAPPRAGQAQGLVQRWTRKALQGEVVGRVPDDRLVWMGPPRAAGAWARGEQWRHLVQQAQALRLLPTDTRAMWTPGQVGQRAAHLAHQWHAHGQSHAAGVQDEQANEQAMAQLRANIETMAPICPTCGQACGVKELA